jgi:hypothetical protein
MECTEVQKRLSAYIEKAVSPQQKALMDNHLKSCKRCKASLADLKQTITYVQQLKEVEPPPWLAQRVMARVRAAAGARQGIWQRLFSPFYIKLPLEAVALVVIAVGAIYILKAMQPAMQLAKIPTETREMAPASGEAPQKETPPVTDQKQLAPARAGDQLMYEKRGAIREAKELEEDQAPTSLAREEETAPPVGYADQARVRRDAAPSSQGLRPTVAVKTKAEGVLFVVSVKDIVMATKDIEAIVRELGGRAVTTGPREDKAVIAIELDSHQVQALFDRLTRIGEVQEEGATREFGEGAVDVRVEVEKGQRNH